MRASSTRSSRRAACPRSSAASSTTATSGKSDAARCLALPLRAAASPARCWLAKLVAKSVARPCHLSRRALAAGLCCSLCLVFYLYAVTREVCASAARVYSLLNSDDGVGFVEKYRDVTHTARTRIEGDMVQRTRNTPPPEGRRSPTAHTHPAAAALKGTRHDHKIARTKGETKGAIRKPPRATHAWPIV